VVLQGLAGAGLGLVADPREPALGLVADPGKPQDVRPVVSRLRPATRVMHGRARRAAVWSHAMTGPNATQAIDLGPHGRPHDEIGRTPVHPRVPIVLVSIVRAHVELPPAPGALVRAPFVRTAARKRSGAIPTHLGARPIARRVGEDPTPLGHLGHLAMTEAAR
jgi:hypothetical protein